MAYMSQENKKSIAVNLKTVIPASWKWSLSVRHHSTLVLTIASAPIDLIAEAWKNVEENRFNYPGPKPPYYSPNEYYLEREFSGELLSTFQDIKKAMMTGNHNNSDPMTDYFDVGWYIDICIGSFEHPFRVSSTPRPGFDFPINTEPTMDELKARIAQLEAKIGGVK